MWVLVLVAVCAGVNAVVVQWRMQVLVLFMTQVAGMRGVLNIACHRRVGGDALPAVCRAGC